MRNKRIASLDLGSNSFHMIIAEVKDNNSFEIIDRRREVIRLGSQKKGEQAFITDEEIKKAIDLLKDYKEFADQYKAEVKAVATSAIRESLNANDFAGKVYKHTSVEVKIISGKREAELIFLGAVHGLNLQQKKVLVIDVGGGSTEIIFGNMNQIVFAESLRVGAVRLSRKFFPEFTITTESIKLCKHYIKSELSKIFKENSDAGYDAAVGASGTILSAASAIYFQKYNRFPEKINGIRFSSQELEELSREVLSKSAAEERLQIPGIEKKRADILPAGLLILNELFHFFNINFLYISEYGLREGILLSHLNSQAE